MPSGLEIVTVSMCPSPSLSCEAVNVQHCETGHCESWVPHGPSGFVYSVAYSPDSKTVLAGGRDYGANRGTLLFWRVADGALMRAYVGQTSTAVHSVQYSPNGSVYAYARDDGAVVLARNPFSSRPPPPAPAPPPSASKVGDDPVPPPGDGGIGPGEEPPSR